MPLITCTSCASQLKAPEGTGGRKFKCPKCGGVFIAPQEPADDDSPEQKEPNDSPGKDVSERPKRKKKKKKAAQAGGRGGVPVWVWWWGSLAVLSALTAAGFLGMAASGYPKLAIICVVRLVIALPISTVIFALSLFISNALGTGVELTDFGTLIPKSLILVLLASLVGLMPCTGGFVAIRVWFIGSMIFFGLEAWETRILVAVNFIIGLAMWLLLIGAITSILTPHLKPETAPTEQVDQR
jgi:hypothetical protein